MCILLNIWTIHIKIRVPWVSYPRKIDDLFVAFYNVRNYWIKRMHVSCQFYSSHAMDLSWFHLLFMTAARQGFVYYFIIILNVFIYFCVWLFCLHVSLYATCMHGDHRGQNKALDLLELQLQSIINCCFAAGYLNQVSGREPVLLMDGPWLQPPHSTVFMTKSYNTHTVHFAW